MRFPWDCKEASQKMSSTFSFRTQKFFCFELMTARNLKSFNLITKKTLEAVTSRHAGMRNAVERLVAKLRFSTSTVIFAKPLITEAAKWSFGIILFQDPMFIGQSIYHQTLKLWNYEKRFDGSKRQFHSSVWERLFRTKKSYHGIFLVLGEQLDEQVYSS